MTPNSPAGIVALLLVTLPASVVTAGSARADCTIYEMRNQGGTPLRVRGGEEYNFARMPHGSTSVREYPEWNDDMSSARIDPGCSLTVWEHVARGGQARTWSAGQRAFLLNYPGDAWNDRASSLICACR